MSQLSSLYYKALVNHTGGKTPLKTEEAWAVIFDLVSADRTTAVAFGQALYAFFETFFDDCAWYVANQVSDVYDSFEEYRKDSGYSLEEFTSQIASFAEQALDNNYAITCFSALSDYRYQAKYKEITSTLLDTYMPAEQLCAEKVFKEQA